MRDSYGISFPECFGGEPKKMSKQDQYLLKVWENPAGYMQYLLVIE